MLTQAAKRYIVVTQVGNQGASNAGTRQLKEWYDAGVIGDVYAVYAWTNRPGLATGHFLLTQKMFRQV